MIVACLIGFVSVLLPLSLCVIPPLARHTVFPLLATIIQKVASNFLQPRLGFEYSFGSFDIKETDPTTGQVTGTRKIKGFSIELYQIQLQESFLQGLALEKKGTAPMALKKVEMKKATLHIGQKWHAVLIVDALVINGTMSEATSDLYGLQEAIKQKLTEASIWVNRYKQATHKDMSTSEAQGAMSKEEIMKKLSLKDRLLQYLVEQVEVQFLHVEVNLTAPMSTSFVSVQKKSGSPRSNDTKRQTKMSLVAEALELTSRIHTTEQDEDKALQRVLVDEDIQVQRGLLIQNLALFVSHEDKRQEEEHGAALVHFPHVEMVATMPPLLRWISAIENGSPIPLEHRKCVIKVKCLVLDEKPLVLAVHDVLFLDFLHAFYVPFANFQVRVASLRAQEALECRDHSPPNSSDVYFIALKQWNDPKTSHKDKEEAMKNMEKVESRLSLASIVELRVEALAMEAKKAHCKKKKRSFEDIVNEAIAYESKVERRLAPCMELLVELSKIHLEGYEKTHQAMQMIVENAKLHLFSNPLKELELDLNYSLGEVHFVGANDKEIVQAGGANGLKKLKKKRKTSGPFVAGFLRQHHPKKGKLELNTSMKTMNILLSAETLEPLLLFVDGFTTRLSHLLAERVRPSLQEEGNSNEKAAVLASWEQKEHGEGVFVDNFTVYSLFGGNSMEIVFEIEGCSVFLCPQTSFMGLLEKENIEEVGVVSSTLMSLLELEVPQVKVHIQSTGSHEQVTVDVKEVGLFSRVYAQKHSDASTLSVFGEPETLLVPVSLTCRYDLNTQVDLFEKPSTAEQKLSFHVSDMLCSLSDGSIGLLSSCLMALTSMKMSRLENQFQKQENQMKQCQKQQEMEIELFVANMKRIFEEMDTDQSGKLELKQVETLLSKAHAGDTLLAKELEYFATLLVHEIDQNGDGKIDFEEFCDFLRQDTPSRKENAGPFDQLEGMLDLRAGEYTSKDELESLFTGNKITSTSTGFLQRFLLEPQTKAKCWELYQQEIDATTSLLNGTFPPLLSQKKLVRLLQNYEAARIVWEQIVVPNLMQMSNDPSIDFTDFPWLLIPFTPCGGISEYESASKMITSRQEQRMQLFALSSMEGRYRARTFSSNHSSPRSNTKEEKKSPRYLSITTDFEIGNLCITLVDPELPSKFSRAHLSVSKIKCSLAFLTSVQAKKHALAYGSQINSWVILADSKASEWTFLFGFQLVAECYSVIANSMEHVIEPWELMLGMCSNQGENGTSFLLEAEKRFQINVTPGLLRVYKTLIEMIDVQQLVASNSLDQTTIESKALQVGIGSRRKKKEGDGCLIQNLTGTRLKVVLNGKKIHLEPDTKTLCVLNDEAEKEEQEQVSDYMLSLVQVDNWGQNDKSTSLPLFGTTNLFVPEENLDEKDASSLVVTAICRLEDPRRSTLVFKSNLYLCNHSFQTFEAKYLLLGSGSKSSNIMSLRHKERIPLPIDLLTGITEFYARPTNFNEWIIKSSLNNDLLVSSKAIASLQDEINTKEQQGRQQQRKGAIIYTENKDSKASKILRHLTPSVVVRRWDFQGHFEWEISLLPSFVIRNSLPFTLEYRFVEYKAESKYAKAEFERLEAQLLDHTNKDVMVGEVASGQDAEIVGLSCLLPGYLTVRVVRFEDEETKRGEKFASAWSKPLLMAIHTTIDQFTTLREVVELGNETNGVIKVSCDRQTMPNLPRLVRFSTPYWIVNNTSFDFAYTAPEHGTKASEIESTCKPAALPEGFGHAIAVLSLEHERLSVKPRGVRAPRPSTWDSLGKVPAYVFKSNPSPGSWSDPMNSTAINTTGEFACGSRVFGMKVEGLYGVYEGSIALTLSSRFFLQNRLMHGIEFQTFASAQDFPHEKVDAFFQSQQQSASSKATYPLELGETVPLYEFVPLRKIEPPLDKCQKYLSIVLDTKTSWSFAIPINAAGDFYLEMYCPRRKKLFICQVSIQVVNMFVYVILSDASSAAPYRIENYTPYTLTVHPLVGSEERYSFHPTSLLTSLLRTVTEEEKQQDSERGVLKIPSGGWRAFAWPNPHSKDRKVQLGFDGGRARGNIKPTRKKTYDIDYVGYQDPILVEALTSNQDEDENAIVEVLVQVMVDENTRVLQLMEKALELQRFVTVSEDSEEEMDEQQKQKQEQQMALLDPELEKRKMLFASSFDLRLAGFGLSLMDGFPQEILFVSSDNLIVQKPASSLRWLVSVFHVQVDNMLPDTRFPVIVNPVNAGYSSNGGTMLSTPEDATVTTGGGQLTNPPVFQLVLESDVTSKIGVYRLLDVQLSTLSLKVDVDYLVNVIRLLEPYLTSESLVQSNSLQTRQRVLYQHIPPVPMAQVTTDGNIKRDLVYFDLLRIHAFALELEYVITRKDIVSGAGGAVGSRSVLFGLVSQVIVLIGSNLGGSPTLNFTEILISRCFSSKSRLQVQLVQNFLGQLVRQAYRMIGSVDLIGNPIGLVEDLGSGVIEFLKITKGEVLGDVQTRGEGIKVLGKTIVKTGAGSMAKITGSLDKFVNEITGTEGQGLGATSGEAGVYMGAVARKGEAPETASMPVDHVVRSGSATGFAPLDESFKFAKELGKGITGILTKPVEGARKGGVTGLVQGTFEGITGPGVVLLKQITSTSHTLALGVQNTVVDRSIFGGRRRLPKTFLEDKLICERQVPPTKLSLEVVGASGLITGSSCNAYCLVTLDDQLILRTKVLYNTANPSWNEKVESALKQAVAPHGTYVSSDEPPLTQAQDEQKLELTVKHSFGGALDHTVGSCQLTVGQLKQDFKRPQYASTLAEWVRTGVKPKDTKTNVSNQVRVKEYTLVSPAGSTVGFTVGAVAESIVNAFPLPFVGGSSSSGSPIGSDEVYQVIVTIVGVKNLKPVSVGGLFGGLGQIVSTTTAGITPYVIATVGRKTNRTSVIRTKSSNTGLSGQWNETFTFPFSKQEFENGKAPFIQFTVRDKSMLHDEILGYGRKELEMNEEEREENQGQLETLELVDKRQDEQGGGGAGTTGTLVGYLELQVEIVSATERIHQQTSPVSTTSPGSTSEETTGSPSTPEQQWSSSSTTTTETLVKAGKIRLACDFS